MNMSKTVLTIAALCLVLTGCYKVETPPVPVEAPAPTEAKEAATRSVSELKLAWETGTSEESRQNICHGFQESPEQALDLAEEVLQGYDREALHDFFSENCDTESTALLSEAWMVETTEEERVTICNAFRESPEWALDVAEEFFTGYSRSILDEFFSEKCINHF